jgi:hypothetical protein
VERQYCTKRTQRHLACGRELLPNTTCPGGYLHEGAARFPRRWAPVVVLATGGLALFCSAFGLFSFIGPFSDFNAATVGTTRLDLGARLVLAAGATEGVYEVGSCQDLGHDTASIIATLVGAGHTIQVRPSRSQPYFSEAPLLLPYASVRQCATFTAPVAGTYLVTSSSVPFDAGVVPSAALWRVSLYHVLPALALGALLAGTVWLSAVLRRRDTAHDPSERPDLTHDTIAQASLANQAFLSPPPPPRD